MGIKQVLSNVQILFLPLTDNFLACIRLKISTKESRCRTGGWNWLCHDLQHTTVLPSRNSFGMFSYLCLPPSGSGEILFLPGCLSVSLCVGSITWKRLSSNHKTLYKYQSAWDDVQSARMATPPFFTFWVISLWTLCIKKSCPLYNLKTTSAIFTKLHTNINQHEMTCIMQEW